MRQPRRPSIAYDPFTRRYERTPPCATCRRRPAETYDAAQQPICAVCWLKHYPKGGLNHG